MLDLPPTNEIVVKRPSNVVNVLEASLRVHHQSLYTCLQGQLASAI